MADKLVALTKLVHSGRLVEKGEELLDVAEDHAKLLVEQGLAALEAKRPRAKKPEGETPETE